MLCLALRFTKSHFSLLFPLRLNSNLSSILPPVDLGNFNLYTGNYRTMCPSFCFPFCCFGDLIRIWSLSERESTLDQLQEEISMIPSSGWSLGLILWLHQNRRPLVCVSGDSFDLGMTSWSFVILAESWERDNEGEDSCYLAGRRPEGNWSYLMHGAVLWPVLPQLPSRHSWIKVGVRRMLQGVSSSSPQQKVFLDQYNSFPEILGKRYTAQWGFICITFTLISQLVIDFHSIWPQKRVLHILTMQSHGDSPTWIGLRTCERSCQRHLERERETMSAI